MDIRRLRHFLAVYEHGSLGQAAEEIHLTQPALSKSIHQLEEELQVQLFERTPLGVVPTVFGEALSMHAKVIQAEIKNAERELARLRGATKGLVKVGIGPSIAGHLMPLAAMKLRKDRPGIELTVIEGLADDHLPALRRGEIDLAIGTWSQVKDTALASDFIAHDQVHVYASTRHPLAGKPVQLGDLLEYPWALPPHPQFWRYRLEEIFLAQGLSPPEAEITSNSAGFLRALLLSGDYLSFLPRQLLSQEEDTDLVAPLQLDDVTLQTEVTVTYRKRAVLSPACHALIDCLKQVCDPEYALANVPDTAEGGG